MPLGGDPFVYREVVPLHDVHLRWHGTPILGAGMPLRGDEPLRVSCADGMCEIVVPRVERQEIVRVLLGRRETKA